jgi:diguanylate cyclase (GGDEF)-like protein/PAS domain S-box-containing protein
LRKAPLVLSCVAIALVTLGVLQAARSALDRSFAGIEVETARQSIERVRRALEADFRQLALTTADYGNWDDTWSYATGENPSYVESELSPDVLSGLHVDLAWVDRTGERDVVSLGTTEAARRVAHGSPSDALAELRHHAAPLVKSLASAPNPPDTATVKLMRTPAGILAVGLVPIRHTDRSGPVVGTFGFARHLGREVIERLEQTSQQPASIIPLDEQGHASRALPPDVAQWLAKGARAKEPYLKLDDPSSLGGYAVLEDLHGQPLALLATKVPRDVLQLGKRTITGVVIAVVVGFSAVVLVLLSFLTRSWRAREATEQRYRTVVQNLDECIILAERDGRILEANPALLSTLGYAAAQVSGLRVQDVFPALAYDTAWRSLARGGGAPRQVTMRTREGRTLPAEVSASDVELEGVPCVCLVARDIRARRQAERQQRVHRRRLAHLARHDSLTGLPNRLQLSTRLPRLIARAREEGTLLALLYIDLDHFKNVNDSLGHGSGDRLLATTAERLRSCIKSGDLIARMGGDEFVVIATGLRDRSDVDPIARRIQETLGARMKVEGSELAVALSIGVALFPDDGADLEELLKAADIALYQAKEHGRGHHRLFNPSMNARLTERLQLENALREALESDRLHVEYQPAFDLKSGKPVSFEALLRWTHPELGQVPPARFIAVAEQSGLIFDLGRYVLRAACAQLAGWQRLGGVQLLPVSINVSARQFNETRRLSDQVAECVREFGVDASLLHFEITESAVMQHLEQHLGTLQALRNLGSRILIDDFGTGYSSLSYLKHLPIDALKIDRAFVRDMATDANDAAIVRAIVGIAHSLGLHLVAEGVETMEQLACLRELGCHSAQGFFFARPMTADACRQLLESQSRRVSDTARMRLVASGEPPV